MPFNRGIDRLPVVQPDRRSRMVATIPEEDDSPTTNVAPLKKRTSLRGIASRRTSPGLPQRKESETSQTTSSTSSSSSGRSSPKSKDKKSVHWYNKVQKKRHIRLADMTDEEKESVWYTEGDSKIILGMAKVTVKMMMKGECPTDDVDYCSRGLEGKTPAGAKRRQMNKIRVRKALLEEQELQREEGIVDTEYLGQVSREHSKDVCIQARRTALTDEQAIRIIWTFRPPQPLINSRKIVYLPFPAEGP